MGRRKTKTNKTMGIEALNKRAGQFFPMRKNDINANRCFVIDGMSLAYTAYYAHNLSYKGKSTSIMFGMLDQLKSLMMLYKAHRVIVCWDGERNPKRIELHPGYKAHRNLNMTKRQKRKFKEEIERVKKMIYYLGISQAYNPAVEGDDMVYWVTKKMQNLYKTWIISGDKDFLQLINYDVQVYNPRTKHSHHYSTFYIDNKVEPSQFSDYLCMVGDKSDDIPGYRGIGPVRAASFLSMFKSIKNFIKDENAEFSGVSDKEELEKVWRRNRMLIDLKRFNEKYHTEADLLYIRNKSMPKFRPEKFKAYCLRYGIKTFTFEKFLKPFQDLSNA